MPNFRYTSLPPSEHTDAATRDRRYFHSTLSKVLVTVFGMVIYTCLFTYAYKHFSRQEFAPAAYGRLLNLIDPKSMSS
jgi:hypothetical protein